jgi:aspartate kinase
MQISKFGGASVKDADAIRNLRDIVEKLEKPQVIVVSAMEKMTNAFEKLLDHYYTDEQRLMKEQFQYIKDFHKTIAGKLFGHPEMPVLAPFVQCLDALERRLGLQPSMHFDFEYDQIVSYGEMLSTILVSVYLNYAGILNQWVDVRQVLKTDDLYRDANVEWELTTRLMQDTFKFDDVALYLTQGFLGGTISNITTTLGREGSDYTAAIIGNVMDADRVTVWKDVPGILNADPRIFSDAKKLDALSYAETIELSYYGAQVIHSKTLKPLQNKQIPLLVKSFIDPGLPGTSISQRGSKNGIPVFILKQNQVFITFSPRDFSFMTEDNLSRILAVFSKFRVRINLLQTSALSFTVCVDNRKELMPLLETFGNDFFTRYNEGVELLTIRNYTQDAINEKTKGWQIIDSQITRNNARFVVRKTSL